MNIKNKHLLNIIIKESLIEDLEYIIFFDVFLYDIKNDKIITNTFKNNLYKTLKSYNKKVLYLEKDDNNTIFSFIDIMKNKENVYLSYKCNINFIVYKNQIILNIQKELINKFKTLKEFQIELNKNYEENKIQMHDIVKYILKYINLEENIDLIELYEQNGFPVKKYLNNFILNSLYSTQLYINNSIEKNEYIKIKLHTILDKTNFLYILHEYKKNINNTKINKDLFVFLNINQHKYNYIKNIFDIKTNKELVLYMIDIYNNKYAIKDNEICIDNITNEDINIILSFYDKFIKELNSLSTITSNDLNFKNITKEYKNIDVHYYTLINFVNKYFYYKTETKNINKFEKKLLDTLIENQLYLEICSLESILRHTKDIAYSLKIDYNLLLDKIYIFIDNHYENFKNTSSKNIFNFIEEILFLVIEKDDSNKGKEILFNILESKSFNYIMICTNKLTYENIKYINKIDNTDITNFDLLLSTLNDSGLKAFHMFIDYK